MHGHLVTIEVGVECCTGERVELDGFPFDHSWLECLNTKSVEGRGTVEENRMTFHHVLQNVPDHRILPVHDFLRGLDRLYDSPFDEFADDERFVKLGCHEFRQTALVHVQFRTYYDYGTGGVVHTLTEEVLTETSLLALQRVGQRLERPVGFALDCA